MAMWAVQTSQELLHTYFVEAESMNDAYVVVRESFDHGMTPNIVSGSGSGEDLLGGWRMADDNNKAGKWQDFTPRD